MSKRNIGNQRNQRISSVSPSLQINSEAISADGCGRVSSLQITLWRRPPIVILHNAAGLVRVCACELK